MKRCSKCGILKPDTEFHKCSQHKDGLKSACKECSKVIAKSDYANNKKLAEHGKSNWKQFNLEQRREASKVKLERNRKLVDSLKTNCVKCNESRRYVIQFHHIDPSTKAFTLGCITSHGVNALVAETKKCVCLCANCHFEFHYLYGNQPISPVQALNEYLGYEVTT